MMVLSEMVRSRSSSFKRSFKKKSENIGEQFSVNRKSSLTKTQQTASGGKITCSLSRNIEQWQHDISCFETLYILLDYRT